jgi:hypothetical protein
MKKLIVLIPLFMMFVGCDDEAILGLMKGVADVLEKDREHQRKLEVARAGASKIIVNTPGTGSYGNYY